MLQRKESRLTPAAQLASEALSILPMEAVNPHNANATNAR
jgi:hypothetical protein